MKGFMNYFRLKYGDFAGYGVGTMVQCISYRNSLVSDIDYVYFVSGYGNSSVIINEELAKICSEVGIL